VLERLDRLTDAYIDRLIDKEMLEERRRSLITQERALEDQLAELRSAGFSVAERVAEIIERAQNVCLSYDAGLPAEKRELAKIITSNRGARGKELVIELRNPYQALANRGKELNGDPTGNRTPITSLKS
jgi:site-specific DNA recombinase